MKRTTGQLIKIGSGDEVFRAFVPAPLPPEPPLKLTTADHGLLERANRALGRLDAMASLLPNTSLFLYAYVRKEALVSSQIEGTQSSFSDLLLYESDQVPGVPLEDVREVSDYVAALNHGIERLRGGFPLSLRLLAGALDRMKRQRIVKELTGFKRNRVFAYAPYVELLSEGTEPIR